MLRPKSAFVSNSSVPSKGLSKPKSAGTRLNSIDVSEFKESIRLSTPCKTQQESICSSSSSAIQQFTKLRQSSSDHDTALAFRECQPVDLTKIIESRIQAASIAYTTQLAAGKVPSLSYISNTADSLVSAAESVFQCIDDIKATKGFLSLRTEISPFSEPAPREQVPTTTAPPSESPAAWLQSRWWRWRWRWR